MKSSLNTICKAEKVELKTPESSTQTSEEQQPESSEMSTETESSITQTEPNIASASPTESVVDTPPSKERAEEPVIPSTLAVAEEVAVPSPAITEPTVFLPINLLDFDSSTALESLGLNHLKHELQRLGLKCGGSLTERASRLYSIKGLSTEEIDPSLLAKPPKKK